MNEEIKKLRRSVNLVNAKLSFMHEQFGELKVLFEDVVEDVDALAELVGSYEGRLSKRSPRESRST